MENKQPSMTKIWCLICLCFDYSLSGNNTELDLHNKLFSSYNPDVKPLKNASEPIEISMKLTIMSIDNIDEKKQSFSVRGYLEVSWTDEYLTWDSSKYQGVTAINVQNKNIWLPDLALRNVFSRPTELGQGSGRAVVNNKGLVIIWPYNLYTVACGIKIRHFPFDIQTCELLFLSWTNPSSAMRLKPANTIELKSYRKNGEWELASHSVIFYQEPFGNDTWDIAKITFSLKRKSLFQVMNIIAPILCITLLNLTCFVVPAESGEKIALCISMFLTLAVFLSTITDLLPESSDEVSILSIYVCLQLLGSGITVICTVISLYLYHRDQTQHINVLFLLLCKVFLRRHTDTHPVKYQPQSILGTEYIQEPAPNRKSFALSGLDSRVTWKIVSRAFDRLCLIMAILWNACLIICLVISYHQ